MFEYELHRMNHAELVRQAAAHRLSREAVKARRAGRRSGRNESERQVSHERDSFARAA
ncbi:MULTISPECIES: hypothetical protein [Streptomyces]|uniref:Uncharacterized protein n=1 Tax=Streptomyces solicathayae TaxID=3081768 RepID=A0ABZ0LR02_9ACTN|nr:hypothetical protein [Streptomyces sp. HUAS YS2]WOX21924.1 hypothetical protein R2D22_11180 [Streptomyces sp. HUAS YS2]